MTPNDPYNINQPYNTNAAQNRAPERSRTPLFLTLLVLIAIAAVAIYAITPRDNTTVVNNEQIAPAAGEPATTDGTMNNTAPATTPAPATGTDMETTNPAP